MILVAAAPLQAAAHAVTAQPVGIANFQQHLRQMATPLSDSKSPKHFHWFQQQPRTGGTMHIALVGQVEGGRTAARWQDSASLDLQLHTTALCTCSHASRTA